jgi:hypothetical protein
MSKTFTCQELGGVCEETFSGDTFTDIMQKGMAHMQTDATHMKKIMNMSDSGETKDQWFDRMQKEFETRSEDK